MPGDRQLGIAHRLHGRALADQQQHRLAPEAHPPFGQDGLVLEVRA
jgi:hypothetical protein